MKTLKKGYHYLVEFRIKQGGSASYTTREEIRIVDVSGVYYQVEFVDNNNIQWLEKKLFFDKHDTVDYGYIVHRCLS